MDKPQEAWKVIPSFPNYEISEFGVVRRLKPAKATKPGKILKSFPDSCGYMRISLMRDKKQITCKVHQLVAEAFIGPRPEGMEVNHIDTVRTNCHFTNLEYCTHLENMRHAFRTTGHNRGEKHGLVKMTEKDVIEARRRRACGEQYQSIADSMGYSRSNIVNAVLGYTWKWLGT